MRGLYFMLVHIDGIAERLEGVKADAHRQQYIYRHPVRSYAEELEQFGQVLSEEVEVLEDAEN